MRLWLLFGGLLLLGLVAPLLAGAIDVAAPLYSDSDVNIILYAMPVGLFILIVLVPLYLMD